MALNILDIILVHHEVGHEEHNVAENKSPWVGLLIWAITDEEKAVEKDDQVHDN